VNLLIYRHSVGPLNYEDAQIAKNFGASVTMASNAVNNLLFHIFLGPIYMTIVMQKITVCTNNAMFAVLDSLGFGASVGRKDLQDASAVVAGVCLSERVSTAANNLGENTANSDLNTFLTNLMSTTGVALTSLLTEPYVHVVDGIITYMIGIIVGMQDIAQTVDSEHCNVPDFYMYQTMTCACGDTPVQIPTEKKIDSNYWCTGTLLMAEATSENDNAVYVYNKYTFQELIDSMGLLDTYMQCISTESSNAGKARCAAERPRLDFIEEQGVSTIAVLQKCRANFQQKQWDSAAHILYHKKLTETLLRGPVSMFDTMSRIQSVSAQNSVVRCLLAAHDQGVGNRGCLQEYLHDTYTTAQSEQYWMYDSNHYFVSNSVNTDACLVFSGVAKNNADPAIARDFQACSSAYSETDCLIPSFIWSAGSRNNVPVAMAHLKAAQTADERKRMANANFDEAIKSVNDILEKNKDFQRTDIEAIIFSADGDSLHQIIDCVMMGPFAGVDLWAGEDSAGKKTADRSTLPVARYARDSSEMGVTRDMDLPCSRDKLRGDTKPPFTCGSESRRSIIKYFVRDFLNAQQVGGSLISKLVRNHIRNLREKWSDRSILACKCAGINKHDLDCCNPSGSTQLERTLLYDPSAVHVPYDTIQSDDVMRVVLEEVRNFLPYLMTNADPILKYANANKKHDWNWGSNGQHAATAKVSVSY
jgi:hypothetical protein